MYTTIDDVFETKTRIYGSNNVAIFSFSFRHSAVLRGWEVWAALIFTVFWVGARADGDTQLTSPEMLGLLLKYMH